jgi:hypothetical protein
MTVTALDVEPGGFVLLQGTFQDGEGRGEAHVRAPDGSICHLQWTTPDDIYFQDVPITQGTEDPIPWRRDADEDLYALFPDLRQATEERQALEHDPIYDSLPDLERQWDAWRATQGE